VFLKIFSRGGLASKSFFLYGKIWKKNANIFVFKKYIEIKRLEVLYLRCSSKYDGFGKLRKGQKYIDMRISILSAFYSLISKYRNKPRFQMA